MKMVEINNLHSYFSTKRGLIRAVDGVSLTIEEGKTLGVVGESGSGKSQTAMSILKLFEKNQRIHEGEVYLEGKLISNLKEKAMYSIRGNKVSMIFQEPMTSLNPVFTVGRQIGEVLFLHQGMKKKQARERAIQLLESVKIHNAGEMIKQSPHQLSGGMRQRVMIAMALACNPKLLIADEPTTALDVTIQAQILDLLRGLKTKTNAGIMLITHDLGVIAEMADYVVVMYAGRVIEQGAAIDIYKSPSHPYTLGLMKSKPIPGQKVKRLYSIPGRVPNPVAMPNYCYFRDRCEYAFDKCNAYPPEFGLTGTHRVSCWRGGL